MRSEKSARRFQTPPTPTSTQSTIRLISQPDTQPTTLPITPSIYYLIIFPHFCFYLPLLCSVAVLCSLSLACVSLPVPVPISLSARPLRLSRTHLCACLILTLIPSRSPDLLPSLDPDPASPALVPMTIAYPS